MKTVELIYVGADAQPGSPDFREALRQTLPRKAHLLACQPDDGPCLLEKLARVRGQADRWVIAQQPPGRLLWPFAQQNDYPCFEFDSLPRGASWPTRLLTGELFDAFRARLPQAENWQEALLEAAWEFPAFDGKAFEALPGRTARARKTFVVGAGKHFDNKINKWLENGGVHLQYAPKSLEFWRALAWGDDYQALGLFDGLSGWTIAPMWKRLARQFPDARWLVVWPGQEKWLSLVRKLWRNHFAHETGQSQSEQIHRFAQTSFFGTLAFLPEHLLEVRESWRRELLRFQETSPGQMRFFTPETDDWDATLAWLLDDGNP